MKKCCVIGLGYIGLPTAAIIAESKHKVIGLEINHEIIDVVSSGKAHFQEKNLNKLLLKVINSGNFRPVNNIETSDIFIITVPTPLKEDNQKIPTPDISYVLNAANTIMEVIKKNDLIIIESTCPVGTAEKISNLIEEKTPLTKDDFFIACCPERVIPGNILNEIVNNDRVIGGINDKSSKLAKDFYSYFCNGKLITTDAKTAELVKLAENSYRDINIAFANELSMICDELKINSKELINIANHHPRVNILNPGCGVGGHCIAVDPWFLASEFPKHTPLIQTGRKVNKSKTNWVINRIKKEINIYKKQSKKIFKLGILGLAFKPDVDDLRESPAVFITEKLISENFNVMCSEPLIKSHERINLFELNEVIEESDIIVILVAHSTFKKADLRSKKVLDFCDALQS